MANRNEVINGLECCINPTIAPCIHTCPYRDMYDPGNGFKKCMGALLPDALELIKEQEVEHRRLLSWLGKFCRHVDNGDTWLTDEENIAFFKEKMKQQFGWDTDYKR